MQDSRSDGQPVPTTHRADFGLCDHCSDVVGSGGDPARRYGDARVRPCRFRGPDRPSSGTRPDARRTTVDKEFPHHARPERTHPRATKIDLGSSADAAFQGVILCISYMRNEGRKWRRKPSIASSRGTPPMT